MRDPSRLGDLLAYADRVLDPERMRPVADRLARHPEAARAMAERPRVGRLDLEALGALPMNSLGASLARHFGSNGLDPDALPRLEADDPVRYARAHLRESHDIWHVVTGFGTDVSGELGLQAFHFAQIEGPLSVAILGGGFLNTLLAQYDERSPRVRAVVRGWLLGTHAKPLFGTRWNELWSTSLADVRRDLGIDLEAVDRVMTRGGLCGRDPSARIAAQGL